MDEAQRAGWRQRLKLAYGAWCCEVCKCAYASQPQFGEMIGVAELIRHSECGHVIMWRAGGADWAKPHTIEPMQARQQPLAVAPARTLRVPIEPHVLPPPQLPRGQRRWVVEQPPPALLDAP